MTFYELFFFLIHCLAHVFCYWLPNACSACLDLLLCRPCRRCSKKESGYAYHPPREVRLIHHPRYLEAAVHVFGLMDAGASTREDRQFCSYAEHHTGKAGLEQNEKNGAGSVSIAAAAAAGNGSGAALDTITTNTTTTKTLSVGTSAKGFSSPCLSGSHQARDADDAPQRRAWEVTTAPGAEEEHRLPHCSSEPTNDTEATYNSQRYPCAATAPSAAPLSPTVLAASDSMSCEPMLGRDARARDNTLKPGGPPYRSPPTTIKKAIKQCRLRYDAPLYGPHVGTIFGAFRPQRHVPYIREEMRAWDGCVVAMDWYYVAGETPTAYDHEHTSRARKAAEAREREKEEKEERGKEARLAEGHEPAAEAPREAHQQTRVVVDTRTNKNNAACSDSAAQQSGQGNSHADSCFHAAAATAVGVVFIVPGLTSYSQTNYVQHLVHVLHAAHLHVCVLSTRGMGDTPPATTPFLFNGAYTRDVRDCLQQFLTKEALLSRFSRVLPLIGLGLSIGGLILSKYIGEEGIAGADPHLDALITCCSPMDYVMTTAHMNRNGAQRALYQRDMCGDIRDYLLRHEALQRLPNVDNDWVFAQGNIHRFHRVLHFDEHVIAPSAGYRSAHHYHLDASAMTWLPYAPIPVLTISSADDPVIGKTVMPHRWRELAHNNARVVYVEPPVGGHLGFLQGPWAELRDRANWMEVFVRDRVLAACAYWTAVQQQHRPTAPAAAVNRSMIGGAAGCDVSPPAGLFSPTTQTPRRPPPVAVESTAWVAAPHHRAGPVNSSSASGSSSIGCSPLFTTTADAPSFLLMRALAGVPDDAVFGGQQASRAVTRAAVQSGRDGDRVFHAAVDTPCGNGVAQMAGDAAVSAAIAPHQHQHHYEEEEQSLGMNADDRRAALATAHSLSSTPAKAPAKATTHTSSVGEATKRDAVSASPVPELPSLALEQAIGSAPATSALSGARGLRSSRPVQYLPPRDDRATNRCYFTYYCTPEVAPSRLQQPFFVNPQQRCQGGGADDDADRLSTATPCIDDERSSMYASCRVAASSYTQQPLRSSASSCSGGQHSSAVAAAVAASSLLVPDGERRRRTPLVCEHDAGTAVAGKDARCMMVTGQHAYPPVVVNCDYVVDPRTLMVED